MSRSGWPRVDQRDRVSDRRRRERTTGRDGHQRTGGAGHGGDDTLGALLPLPLMNAADSAKSIDSPISPGNCASRFESWKISNEPVTYAVSIAASTVTPPVVGEPSVNADPQPSMRWSRWTRSRCSTCPRCRTRPERSAGSGSSSPRPCGSGSVEQERQRIATVRAGQRHGCTNSLCLLGGVHRGAQDPSATTGTRSCTPANQSPSPCGQRPAPSIMRVAFSRASSDTAYDMRRYSVFSTAVSARSISAGSSSAMRLTTSTSANGSTRVGAT